MLMPGSFERLHLCFTHVLNIVKDKVNHSGISYSSSSYFLSLKRKYPFVLKLVSPWVFLYTLTRKYTLVVVSSNNFKRKYI